MISTIIWNIRAINTQGVMERLKNLNKIHHVSMIAVLEPFSDNNNINMFKSMLAMDHATSNINGKIWLFWNTDISCTVLEADEQQVTCEISHTEVQGNYIKTFVYAKCKEYLREPLWDKLLHFADTRDTTPWCTVGDFNVITDIDEKLGGIPYNMRKSLEFIGVIEACGLMDLGFNGPKFTWSNQRGINFRIWKRLDRAMVNDSWLQNMPHTCITYLPSVGSDHCPLLMEMVRGHEIASSISIPCCWVEQPSFEEAVSLSLLLETGPWKGNPMWIFHQKMKRLASTLSAWSKMQFGDIYGKVRDFEKRVKVAEDNLLQSNTEKHREELHSINAEYIRYMKLEDAILKQNHRCIGLKKVMVTPNTSMHSLEKGGGDYLSIKSSMIMMNGYKEMNRLQRLREEKKIDELPMECIPRIVSQEHNDRLKEIPSIDELKEVVYSMNPNSAAGPDGMNGYFFTRNLWNIINKDLMGT
ncbi:hypothetical protein H5410_026297 [Solanum commersonii]|uniref:Uncharacterized protein n=1 Tax=Solanum commersonii TaxID=4109 RepID=A0A9J5YY91_SOLCO|nr:hypothetical protein H5410_026297 [Solanum commersonii]